MNGNNYYDVHGAASRGLLDSVRGYLASGKSIDASNFTLWGYNTTPLMCAAANGHAHVVRYLLEQGANPELRSTGGDKVTALLLAIDQQHPACVKDLLKAGASIQPIPWGKTSYRTSGMTLKLDYNTSPLLWAAERGATACVELLLDHIFATSPTFAVTTISTERGSCMRTPLMLAAMNGCDKVVELLLSRDAWTHTTDLDGKTALDLATQSRATRCIALLRQHSAERYAGLLLPGFAPGAGFQPHKTPNGANKMSAVNSATVHQLQGALSSGGSGSGSGSRGRPLQPSQDESDLDDLFGDFNLFSSDDEEGEKSPPTARTLIFRAGSSSGNSSPATSADVGADTPSPTPSKPTIGGLRLPSPPPPLNFTAAAPAAASPTTTTPPSSQIPFDSLTLGEILYDSSHSIVHASRWMGADVAVRQHKAPAAARRAASAAAAAATAAFLQGAQTLASLQHPNLLTCLGVCIPEKEGKGSYAVVAERFSGSDTRGSLFQLLRAAREGSNPALPASMTWARRLRLAAGTAAGTAALAHRNALDTLRPALTSAKILVTSSFDVKLAPCGLEEMMGASNLPSNSTAWLPPELVIPGAGLTLGPAAAAYSLGVILWELLLWEQPPWEGIHGSSTAVTARRPSATVQRDRLPGPLPEAPGTYDAYLKLMDRCLDTKKEQRPGLEAICEELGALVAAEEEAAGKKKESGGGGGEWDSDTCIICCRRKRNVVLAHEGGQCHRLSCAECALRLQRRGDACPLCRRDFEIYRIFDA